MKKNLRSKISPLAKNKKLINTYLSKINKIIEKYDTTKQFGFLVVVSMPKQLPSPVGKSDNRDVAVGIAGHPHAIIEAVKEIAQNHPQKRAALMSIMDAINQGLKDIEVPKEDNLKYV